MLLDHAILLPAAAMAFLTGIALVRLASDRIAELRARKVHPQQVATARQSGELLTNVRSADHYRNLFEAPVLFYVLCGYLAVAKLTTVLLLACAWGYVALRALHTYIQLTHNNVVRRFQVFMASAILLYFMWALFAVAVLTRR